MSNYLRLRELRSLALRVEDYELAEELLQAAQALVEEDKVTDEEFLAASYL
jgi:hypothetical protein